jgi:hypothetical protein
MPSSESSYDDGRIACDGAGLTIRWYYPWGAKRIPYRAIRSAEAFPLRRLWGKWRIWGSGDLRSWYHLDGSRPGKQRGIRLETGRWVRPCLTPDDVDAVLRVLDDHLPA